MFVSPVPLTAELHILKRKPASSERRFRNRPLLRVVVRVGREDCLGVIEDELGKTHGAAVEVPSPEKTFRLLWYTFRDEWLIPEEVRLELNRGLPEERVSAARSARDWLVAKFEKWLAKAACLKPKKGW